MTTDVIKNMIFANSYLFDSPTGIRCIDDRDDRQKDDTADTLPDIAIPGAGLGILLDVLGGLNLLSEKGIEHDISRDLVYKIIYDVTGGVPYHSDEKKVNDLNPAAGCGHFALALKHKEKYLLTAEDVDFIEKKVLPSLAQKKTERVLYAGGHGAKAVVVIDSLRLGLPSLLSNGDRVYVYSKRYHEILLDETAFEIKEKIGVAGVERNILRDCFARASEVQRNATLEHLASSLPVFSARVDDKGDAVVTLNQ